MDSSTSPPSENQDENEDENAEPPDFSWTWVLGSWERMMANPLSRRLELGSQGLNHLNVHVLSFLTAELEKFPPAERLRVIHVGEIETPPDSISEVIPLLADFLACNQPTLHELRFGLSPQLDLWARALRMHEAHAWPINLEDVGFSNVTIEGSDMEWFLRRIFAQKTLRSISFNRCAIDDTLLQNVLPYINSDLESFAWNRRNHVLQQENNQPTNFTILVAPLLNMLASNKNICWKQLHLREHDLTAEDLPTLTAILNNNPHLEFLDLSWNDFFPSTDGDLYLSKWLEALRVHPRLSSLRLVRCHLDNRKASILFQALKSSCSLKEIVLPENPLDGTGDWVDYIPQMIHLETLSLPHIQQLGNQQQLEHLYQAAQKSLSLEIFHLYYEFTPRQIKLFLWRNRQWRRVRQEQPPTNVAVWPQLLRCLHKAQEASPLFGFLQTNAGSLVDTNAATHG